MSEPRPTYVVRKPRTESGERSLGYKVTVGCLLFLLLGAALTVAFCGVLFYNRSNERAASRIESRPSTGNIAHDSLMALSDADKSLALAKALPGEGCVVVRTFYQGMDSNGAATWNAGCRDGRAFVVSVKADSQGSTSYMSCELLRAATKLSCFEPLK